MKKTTFRDYKIAIKKQYEIVKKEEVSGILANPSPAQMRTLCLIIFDKGMSRKDEAVFRLFFETKENEALRKSIENCVIEKFKPIISFLKGERDSESSIRIEMSALLLDFKPRPYAVFSDGERSDGNDENVYETVVTNTVEVVEKDSEGTTEVTKNDFNDLDSSTEVKRYSEKRSSKKKFVVLTLLIVSIFLVGYTSKQLFFSDDCMQWNGDHYEKVICEEKVQGIGSFNKASVFDSSQFNLHKIEVCDTTTFFVRDKAVVWYCKVDGKPEYFTSHGCHPVTGKPLKPITDYIIKKYIEKHE